MYVVSINDRGEERNYLATILAISGSQINATINGVERKFDLSQLIDIESVKRIHHKDSTQAVLRQRRLF
jgi:hypothetical protein